VCLLTSVQEINLLIETFGKPQEMPPISALSSHGPPGMTHAVRSLHGGKEAVARRMGLTLGRMPRGFWCAAANRERAVLELVADLAGIDPKMHKLGMMPSKRSMVALGRANLAQAIERHGGFAELARALGLEYRSAKSSEGKGMNRISLCVCLSRDGGQAKDENEDIPLIALSTRISTPVEE
jgi:hypothetical protein